jgi:hypothetical protein
MARQSAQELLPVSTKIPLTLPPTVLKVGLARTGVGSILTFTRSRKGRACLDVLQRTKRILGSSGPAARQVLADLLLDFARHIRRRTAVRCDPTTVSIRSRPLPALRDSVTPCALIA